MDLRSLQKPLKEHYRSDPNASQIMIRAKGGQTGCSHRMLGRHRACHLPGRGPPGSRRRRHRRLFRRPFAWGSGGLRANYLSDGGGGHGHTNRTH